MALPTNKRPMNNEPHYDFHITDAKTGETLCRAHKSPREAWLLASSWAVNGFLPNRPVIVTIWPV